MKKLVFYTIVTWSLLSSQLALAIFELGLQSGRRWYVTEDSDGEKSGTRMDANSAYGRLAVFPMVSFGLALTQLSAYKDDLQGFDSFTGTEAAADVAVAIPFVPFATPFARLTVPLYSSYEIKGSNIKALATYDNGWIANVGLKFSILPLFAFTVEAGKGVLMYKASKIELNGTDVTTDENKEAEAVDVDNVMIGVEFGL